MASERGPIRAVTYGQHPLTGEAEPYVVDARPDMTVQELVDELRRVSSSAHEWRMSATLIAEAAALREGGGDA
jgi:hypothetical protein